MTFRRKIKERKDALFENGGWFSISEDMWREPGSTPQKLRLVSDVNFPAPLIEKLRKGRALDRTAMQLTVGALEQAIERRQPEPGLVHHSARGLQYARAEYIAILEKHHMVPEHESSGQSIRQFQLRKLHQNAEAGKKFTPTSTKT